MNPTPDARLSLAYESCAVASWALAAGNVLLASLALADAAAFLAWPPDPTRAPNASLA